MTLIKLDGREPPKQILIWERGKFSTSKGAFLFDDKAAKSVMAEYARAGNDLCFDYAHAATSKTSAPEDGKAAGWFKLALDKSGSLWAVDIKWTDKAAKMIAGAEWRYFSPTFESEPKTGRIVSLVNIALTNIPATYNLTPLVAASKRNRMLTMSQKTAKIAALRKSLDDAEAEEALDDAPDADGLEALAARCKKLEDELSKLNKAKKLDDSDSEPSALEELKKRMKRLEDSVRKMADDGDSPDSGDDEDGPSDDEPAQTGKLSKIVLELTGAKDVDEAIGRLYALSQNAASAATVDTSKHAEDVEAAIKAGKITPANRKVALGMSPKTLRAFVSAAKSVTGAQVVEGEIKTARKDPLSHAPTIEPVKLDDGRVVHLSANELAACRAFGNDPKQYAMDKASR